jgi:chloramphenicol-sensitive protein RarD
VADAPNSALAPEAPVSASPAAPSNGFAALDRVGLTASIGAYLIWGFFPLYFKILAPAGPVEIVAHRALWALPTMLIALALARRLRSAVAQIARPSALGALLVTALLIGGNWLVYVYAIQNDQIVQASLGYYINPLVSVAMGVVFLKERLSRLGWLAIALAAAGVLNQIIVVGEVPWIALTLAASFATYGFLRKVAKVDAGAGLLAETAMMAPVAFAAVAWLETTHAGHALGNPGLLALLVLTGPLTAAPLFLFAVGARRLPLIAVGVLQFSSPTIQFLLGLAFGEPFTLAHATTFALVWAGLLVFTRDLLVKDQSRAGGRS